MIKTKDLQKVKGHRKRLRERFLQGGLDGFLDYEIVELLLTLGTPRKDCKQIAKEAIKKFGSLSGVFEASPEELQQVKGIGLHNIFGIKLFQVILERHLKEKIPKRIKLDSLKAVTDYLKQNLGKKKKEYFKVLSLDSRNKLISIDDVSIGTINASLVHPREVFKTAIQHLAVSIIIVHNHPSGDPEPSEDDIEITKRLVKAGKIIGIDVLDHIIITKTKFFSFKEKKLI